MDRSTTPAPAPAVGDLEDASLADRLAQRCYTFLGPLLRQLDRQLDRRLVRTVANTVTALVRHRNRPQALLLSELGALLAGTQQAPAGTKRLANLLHSDRWQAAAIDDYLLSQGQARVAAEAGRVAEGRALCILVQNQAAFSRMERCGSWGQP